VEFFDKPELDTEREHEPPSSPYSYCVWPAVLGIQWKARLECKKISPTDNIFKVMLCSKLLSD